MKISLFPALILTLVLFSTIDLNAQNPFGHIPTNTRVQTQDYDWPATAPMGPNDPFTINRVLDFSWVLSEGESTATDKVYRSQTGYPATLPSGERPDCFQLGKGMGVSLCESYYAYFATFRVNDDMNITLDYIEEEKTLLILTDQLMQGILTVRDITGQ